MTDERGATGYRRPTLSCTIIAKDEADRIGRCIASVKGLADEVVVVDSGSTDGTVALAEGLGARCLFNAWTGYGQQKRFAEDRAAHDWILNLDADEWLTEAVRAELAGILSRPLPPAIHAFEFRIEHVYPGHDKPRPFADYHSYIRLYDKTRCRFPESSVFDRIHVSKAHVTKVRAPIYHQSIRSIGHLIEKNTVYFRLQQREIRKSPFVVVPRLFLEPFLIFFKYYIIRRHVTGGFYGFRVAAAIAMLRTYRLGLMLDRRNGRARREPGGE